MSNSDRNAPSDHHPNQTVSTPSDPSLPPDTPALPRDPNQPIHRKPRVFIHRMNEDPAAETQALQNTSYITALRTVSLSDFKTVGQTPCFRDAMLPGIGGGMGLGALRFVVGGSMWKGMNYAAAGFMGISVVMYQVCQRRRAYDKEGIRQAVKVLDEKQKIKEQEEAAKKKEGETSVADKSIWNTFRFW